MCVCMCLCVFLITSSKLHSFIHLFSIYRAPIMCKPQLMHVSSS